MKRNMKKAALGSPFRSTALVVMAAALLLLPVASASAANPQASIVIEGSGSGKVVGAAPLEGVPPIDCEWDGAVQTGTCSAETIKPVGLPFAGIKVNHEAAPGSVFAEWKIVAGTDIGGCEQEAPTAGECSAATFGEEIIIKAVFEEEIKPKFSLTVTTSGSAGSVECKIGSGSKGACPTEVPEGKSVELFAVPGTGSELNEWTTGSCAGTSSNPCSFTMPASAVSANADFKVASETLSVTEGGGGTGSVACEVNSSSAPCNGTYSYGDSVKVVATPAAENIIESLTGTGSAAGNCNVGTGICEFTLTAPSTVAVVFEAAGTKDEAEGNVHGEVPQTTSLESGCSDVDLGEFIPAVAANYTNTCTVTATSTGAATSLTASDESAIHTGHLVQGTYFLPSPLETRANGGTFESLESPVTLLTYSNPVSADNVNVGFRQHIGLHDGLHTGTYAKTITLTLEQTTP